MSNPEFKRNLWLSLSPHRLVAMPVLLVLTLLAVALGSPADQVAGSLYTTSITLFIFIVWLWGARNANSAIVDELRDKTWDQQRMSALAPWTMTWGKLFGATSFNWYGGLMCLPVMLVSGYMAGETNVIPLMLALCAVGVLVHAALIALNLHTSQFDARIIQRGGLGWLAIIAVFLIFPSYNVFRYEAVLWWGTEIDSSVFWLDSALLFAGCATFAAWRVVSNALQVRTRPWAWPAFALILAVYFGGFLHKDDALLTTALFVSIAMTYVALFSEPTTLLRWRRLRMLQNKGDWQVWLEHLPLWPTTLALTFVVALLLQLAPMADSYWRHEDFLQPPYALTLALMLLRDACILMFFAFAPDSKRAVGATLLYLFVLGMLLPFLAGVAGVNELRYFFLPFEPERDPWDSVLVMTIHTAIAIWLVSWRLRKSEPQ